MTETPITQSPYLYAKWFISSCMLSCFSASLTIINWFKHSRTGVRFLIVVQFDWQHALSSDWLLHAFFCLSGFKCPVCSKSVAPNEMEVHFIMCLSKPRLSYNGKPRPSHCVPHILYTCHFVHPPFYFSPTLMMSLFPSRTWLIDKCRCL